VVSCTWKIGQIASKYPNVIWYADILDAGLFYPCANTRPAFDHLYHYITALQMAHRSTSPPIMHRWCAKNGGSTCGVVAILIAFDRAISSAIIAMVTPNASLVIGLSAMARVI